MEKSDLWLVVLTPLAVLAIIWAFNVGGCKEATGLNTVQCAQVVGGDIDKRDLQKWVAERTDELKSAITVPE